MLTDDELDVRLNLADPVRSVVLSTDALRELTAATRRASRRRRGWRIGISVGALAAVILGGAVAAPAVGVRYIAETLWHPAIGGEIRSNSEWIDTSASDAAAGGSEVDTPAAWPDPGARDRRGLEELHGQSGAYAGIQYPAKL
ncbi:MAG: hypothetical protein JWP75_2716 [Frondihabitans sp.]|nr:hypothetical protein [Frondihabitans sp.]